MVGYFAKLPPRWLSLKLVSIQLVCAHGYTIYEAIAYKSLDTRKTHRYIQIQNLYTQMILICRKTLHIYVFMYNLPWLHSPFLTLCVGTVSFFFNPFCCIYTLEWDIKLLHLLTSTPLLFSFFLTLETDAFCTDFFPLARCCFQIIFACK